MTETKTAVSSVQNQALSADDVARILAENAALKQQIEERKEEVPVILEGWQSKGKRGASIRIGNYWPRISVNVRYLADVFSPAVMDQCQAFAKQSPSDLIALAHAESETAAPKKKKAS